MALYYLQDLASGNWLGPYEATAIRQYVANGYIEPTRCVWSGQPTDAFITASNIPIPAPPGIPFWGKLLLAASGGAAVGLLVGTAITVLTEKPKRPPPRRRPQSRLPPPDPETMAIRRSARRHVQRGAEVRADIPGWPRPPVLDGRIPDVHADYGDRVMIEEYENEQSISRTHAVVQNVTFARWANRSHRREYTQLLVLGGRGGRA